MVSSGFQPSADRFGVGDEVVGDCNATAVTSSWCAKDHAAAGGPSKLVSRTRNQPVAVLGCRPHRSPGFFWRPFTAKSVDQLASQRTVGQGTAASAPRW